MRRSALGIGRLLIFELKLYVDRKEQSEKGENARCGQIENRSSCARPNLISINFTGGSWK